MKFIQAVHESIKSCTSTMTLLGGTSRVFQSYAPVTTALPYIVVGAESDEYMSPTLSGNTDTIRKATVPISIITSAVNTSAIMANELRVELYNASGTLPVAGIVVKNIHISTMSYDWDPGDDGSETGAHICVVNLIFIYTASTPIPIDLSGA